MKRLLMHSLLTASGLFCAASGWAQEAVIVNPANPLKTLTREQVSDLYFGRIKAFPNGEFPLILDQTSEAVRSDFFQALAGMPLYQVNVYWSRLKFSGRVLPPQQLPDDSAVIDMVRRNPRAIGFVRNPPKDGSVRVVLQLTE
jgi:ABC-type phosphate transport system substrate-binding protein